MEQKFPVCLNLAQGGVLHDHCWLSNEVRNEPALQAHWSNTNVVLLWGRRGITAIHTACAIFFEIYCVYMCIYLYSYIIFPHMDGFLLPPNVTCILNTSPLAFILLFLVIIGFPSGKKLMPDPPWYELIEGSSYDIKLLNALLSLSVCVEAEGGGAWSFGCWKGEIWWEGGGEQEPQTGSGDSEGGTGHHQEGWAGDRHPTVGHHSADSYSYSHTLMSSSALRLEDPSI